MALHVNKDDVPTVGFDTGESEVETRMVYGEEMSMVHATRPDDYHSDPHVHPAEQLNYVLEGSIWLFVEDEAALLEPGDFHRVPGMAVHWAKVEEGPCVLVESHAPPYTGDEELAGADREKVVGLFREDEHAEPSAESGSVWAAKAYAEREDEFIAAYREEHEEG